MKCDHKFVDMEDGSRDKFCVRCGNRFAQAFAQIPTPEISVQVNLPDPSKNMMMPMSQMGAIGGSMIKIQDKVIEALHNEILRKNRCETRRHNRLSR